VGLDTVELVMAVEEAFQLEIPDAAAEKMFTVADMHACLVGALRRLGKECDDEEVFERMRAIIVRQLGVRQDEVIPSARFVKDLHAD
jgi:acyl carrier protein